jgi:hypothetical protein
MARAYARACARDTTGGPRITLHRPTAETPRICRPLGRRRPAPSVTCLAPQVPRAARPSFSRALVACGWLLSPRALRLLSPQPRIAFLLGEDDREPMQSRRRAGWLAGDHRLELRMKSKKSCCSPASLRSGLLVTRAQAVGTRLPAQPRRGANTRGVFDGSLVVVRRPYNITHTSGPSEPARRPVGLASFVAPQ